jgi:hypothetical protein
MSGSALITQATLKAALDAVHQVLNGTVADGVGALAHRPAPGNANSIGSSYAHAILSEYGFVNSRFKGQTPFWAGPRAGPERASTSRCVPSV